MKRSRAYFFTGIDGLTGHRFRTENRPRRIEFEDLFDSVPFILESTDSAQENQSGHIRLETDTRAKGRMAPLSDGWARAAQGHQLPVVRNQTLAGDVVVSTGIYGGIKITEVDAVDPLSGRVRRDYIVESGLALASSDGSFVITPIVNGFDLTASPGLADTYMVMADAGDPAPGYLSAKIGDSLYITAGHKLDVRHSGMIHGAISTTNNFDGVGATLNVVDTNTIQLIVGGNLLANLRYNGTWFTEDAGTGLRLLPHGITQNEIALGTLLGTNVNVTPGQFFGDGLNHDGTRMYARVQKSIQLDPTAGANVKPIELVGDLAAPGASMYYGTDGAGNKGWFTTIPFFDSPWEYTYSNTSVSVKNTLSETRSPYSVATGCNSNPWIAGSLGNAANSWTQSMKVMMRGSISVPGTCNLNTADSRLLWIPEDSVAFIKGTAIAQDIATNDMAVYKFSFTAKNIAGVVSVSDILYDTTTAPFHVVQAGVVPYATEYTADITPDFHIYAAGDKIRLDGFGIVGKSLRWTCELNMHVNGGSTFVVPAYVP